MISIRRAHFPDDLNTVKILFREYADSLDIDLEFQDFETELATLPGKYAEPQGCVLLAWHADQAVGCIAFRPIDHETCEMKRLYVKPENRSLQAGRQLISNLCDEARKTGYRRMFLDTIPSMASAIRLYTSFGFKPVAPYIYNPLEGVMFLGLDLTSA